MAPQVNNEDEKTTANRRQLRARERVRVEEPALIDTARGPVVFGPGLDDFNEYDDPC